jgi:uncharacterized protein
MPATALIDTGVVLALVDRNDRWHGLCVDAYQHTRLPLLTTEAVLAEVFHLTYRELGESKSVWRLLSSGAIEILSIANHELRDIQRLMFDYADHPMDFADATLVHIAAREGISLILTIDYSDFETYRIAGRKRFIILPLRTKR